MVSGHPRRLTAGRPAETEHGSTGIRAMRVRWSYCLGGIGLAALSLVVGLEVEIATARPDNVSTTIDRTFKGDRLGPTFRPDFRPDFRPSVTPAGQPKLPNGCESSVSTIRSSPVIGRCFAAAPTGKLG